MAKIAADDELPLFLECRIEPHSYGLGLNTTVFRRGAFPD
jgi:hypothetical protein